jgi:hypothetical protein
VEASPVPDTQLTRSFTLAAWIAAGATAGRPIVVKRAASPLVDGFELGLDSFRRPYIRINQSTDLVATSSPFPSDGSWRHLAATYDGAALTLYCNKLACAQQAFTFPGPIVPANGLPLIVGAPVTGTSGFLGNIDNVVVYRRALSALEISGL